MLIVKLSTAATIEIGPVLDSTGVGVEYSGLAITELRLVKNGTGAAMASQASITHVLNGHYTLVMTTGNTDTLGTLTVSCHKVGYQMPRVQMMVVPAKVYDSIVAGSDNLEVDAIQLLGTAILTPATAGTLDVNTKLLGGATVNATTSVTIPGSSTLATTAGAVGSVTAVSTGAITAASFAAGAIDANAIATDAIGSAEISADAVTKIQSGLATPTNITAGTITTVSAVTGLTVANLDTTVSSRASQTSLDTLDDLVDTEVGAIKTKTDQLTFTIANQIDSNSLTIGDNAITAAAIATDAIGSAEISAAAVTKIQSGLATPTNITAGTITTVSSVTGLTVANLDTTVSSRASQTSLDTLDDLVDTEVAAIKTKTDQLTFTIANQIDSNSLTIGDNAITASALATDAVNEIQSGLATPTNITAATGVVLSGVTHTGAVIPTVTTVNGLAAGVITAASIAADAITDAKVASDVTIASVTGAVGSVTAVSTGAITAASFAAGAIDATAIATDAIGSAEISAAAVTKIQAGLATPTNITAITGNITGSVNSVTSPVTVGTINADVITATSIANNAIDAATFAADVDAEARTWLGLATASLDTQLAGISTAVNANDIATKIADAGAVTTGTVVSGTYASTYSDNDAYWITAPVTPAVGGYGLRQSLRFDLPLNRVTTQLQLNGYWTGSGTVVDVFALNNRSGSYDQLTNTGTNLASRNNESIYAIPIPRDYIDATGGVNNIVTIELRSTSTTTTFRLRLDRALIYHVAEEAAFTGTAITVNDIWTAPSRTLTTLGSEPATIPTTIQIADEVQTRTIAHVTLVDTTTNLTNAPTAGDLTATMKASVTAAVPTVDQVWDELLSGHTVSGSTGAGLSAAGAAGDPWSTLIPGAYGSGTAGKILGDNVNATISSRASQTSLDTLDDLVDTEVGAIKTKTDQLTFTVANQIDANSLAIGANAITATAIATDAIGALEISAAAVTKIQAGLATPTNITAGTITTVSTVTGLTAANLDATVSSRASQTSLDTLDDYVDTEVAAIKAKTDQLTFTVANQVDSNSLTNGGPSESGIRSAIGMATANLDTQIGTLATPTNITAGTITTVTNLTNAATSGDLTQTMKNSVTAIVPTAAQNFAAVLTTALTESYAAGGAAPTLAQAILLIQQSLHEFAIASTTRTVKKLDGSTTAATFTLNSATAPTATTRAT